MLFQPEIDEFDGDALKRLGPDLAVFGVKPGHLPLA